jgi:hypothetical protein
VEAIHQARPDRRIKPAANEIGNGLADGNISSLGIHPYGFKDVIVNGKSGSHEPMMTLRGV